jgi:glycosyltransferase involved in cell wall biosynthesis
LAKSLASLDNEIKIIIPAGKGTFKWDERVILQSITGIIPRKFLKFFSNLIGVSKSESLFLYDLSFLFRSRYFIRDADIIQLEGAVTSALIIIVVKKIFKKFAVVDSHDAFQALRIEYKSGLRKNLEIFLEKVTYRYADLILAVSEIDKKILIKQGIQREKIVIIPNGVDTVSFTPKVEKINNSNDKNKMFQVIFVGNMEYLPNQEAASLIINQIAPKVLNRIKNVNFILIGRTPLKLKNNLKNITFTGVVDNVAGHLTASDVAIAPLLQGSGTRLKILEYFSCGLPVISTSVGAEGLDVTNNTNILIEDDVDGFVNSLVNILEDKELRRKMGVAARELVIKKYDWMIIGKQLNEIYSKFI